MKIAVVVPSYWPAIQYGGTISCLHDLNKAMVAKGVGVTVFTIHVGLDEAIERNVPIDVDGVTVYYFSFSKSLEALGSTGWQYSRTLANKLKHSIKQFDIVSISAIWSYPAAIAAFYCGKFNKPYIVSPHGMIYPYTFKKKYWKKLPYYKFITERILRNASAIHYTTKDERDKCHQYLQLRNKAFIIPNGLNLDEYKFKSNKDGLLAIYPHLRNKKVILFLGRITWKKGLDILIDAFGKLAMEREEYHLLIVGNDEGRYIEQIKTRIKMRELKYNDLSSEMTAFDDSARVTFTGILQGEKKIMAFSGSDIFVLPSYSENFGMTVIEAMASGTPVIISDQVGLSGDINKNDAGIIIETSAQSLYNGLMQLAANEQHRKELSKNGRDMVEKNYSINYVAEKTINIYNKLIKNV